MAECIITMIPLISYLCIVFNRNGKILEVFGFASFMIIYKLLTIKTDSIK